LTVAAVKAKEMNRVSVNTQTDIVTSIKYTKKRPKLSVSSPPEMSRAVGPCPKF